MAHDTTTLEYAPVAAKTKTQAACEAIADMAGQVGAGERLPSVQALSQTLGVSWVTLDRALHTLETQGTIVRRHGRGIFAAPTTTRTVGILFGLDPFRIACSPVYALLFEALRSELAQRDLELETYVDLSCDQEHLSVRKRLENDIKEGNVHGLLLPASGREQWQWVEKLSISCVAAGGPSIARGYRVERDWPFMISHWVNKLVASGCQRIGLIPHIKPREYSWQDERGAFDTALNRHHLTIDDTLIFEIFTQSTELPEPMAQSYDEKGYGFGKKFIADNKNKLLDGLVICDDMFARGFLTALSRGGIRIGKDIQVATHTNKGSSSLYGFEENLITTQLNPKQGAMAMVSLLETLMDGNKPEHEEVMLRPE